MDTANVRIMAQEVCKLTPRPAVEGSIKMEKRWIKWFLLVFAVLLGMIYVLNIKVTTKQGINFQVRTIEIPLYLKVLDFFDRHYNYKWTVERIIGDSKVDEEKIMKIFKWTHENIKKIPEGYPVIDDHVWHIIVRGYGDYDQSSDVFTALCNYAGVDAFLNWAYTEDRSSRIPLSFVKINEKWYVFDPYNEVYFKNRKGNLADIEDMINGDWTVQGINNSSEHEINYAVYLKNLSPVKEIELTRANSQSPLNRLKYEIKKWLK